MNVRKLLDSLETVNYLLQRAGVDDVKMDAKEIKAQDLPDEWIMYTIEKRNTLLQLKRLIAELKIGLTEKNLEEKTKPLQQFLADRWNRVRGTDLSYVYTQGEPVADACTSTAQALASVLKKSFYELLMPTIDLEAKEYIELIPLKEKLEEKELQFHNFIMSDDDTRIIEVVNCLNSAEEEGGLRHTTLFNDQPKNLSEAEYKRVINHSQETKQYYDASQAIVKLKKGGDSTGAYLKRLLDSLREGSYKEKGEEMNAAGVANEGIVAFNEFFETLSPEEQRKLLNLSDATGAKQLSNLWGRLARPKDQSYEGVRYCIYLIANDLEAILEHNKRVLYDAKNDLENREKARANAKDKLERVGKGYRYVINPGYGFDGRLRLLDNLARLPAKDKNELTRQLGLLLTHYPTEKWVDEKKESKSPVIMQIAVVQDVKPVNKLLNSKEIARYITTPSDLGILLSKLEGPNLEIFINKNFDHIKSLMNTGQSLQELMKALDLRNSWKATRILERCGKNFLFDAVEKNDIEMVRLLLNMGISPQESKEGLTLTHLIVLKNHKNNVEMLKEISTYSDDFRQPDKNGETPLDIAIANNRWDLVGVMFKADPELIVRNGWKLPHIVAQQSRFDMLNHIADTKSQNQQDKNGNTPLHVAVENNNPKMIKALSELKINFDIPNNEGLTPAHIAIQKGRLDVIEELMVRKANFNIATPQGKTPLMLALENKRLDILVTVLNIDQNKMLKDGWSLPHFIVNSGRIELLKPMAESKIEMDQADNVGDTPLHLAAKSGNAEITTTLIELKSNLDKDSKQGVSPLLIAAMLGHAAVIESLARAKANLNRSNKEGLTAAHIAAYSNHSSVIEALVRNKADINKKSSSGETPAHYAARKGDAKILRLLALAQANLNHRAFRTNMTPAEEAVMNTDNADIIKTLTEFKFDFYDVNDEGKTLPHHAIMYERNNIVKELVAQGISFNRPDAKGQTAFDLALQNRNLDLVALMLKIPIDQKRNMNAAHMVALRGRADLIKSLVKNKIDLNGAGSDTTPAHLAAEEGHTDVIIALLESKADLNKQNAAKQTPVEVAINSGRTDIVKILAHGNMNLTKGLFTAATLNYPGIIRILSEYKANLNAMNENGDTAAHLAAKKGSWDALRELARQDVDFSKRNQQGKSVAEIIIENHSHKPEAISALALAYKLKPSDLENKKWSVAHFVGKFGDSELTKSLTELKDFNFNSQDSDGNTPAHIAIMTNNLDLIKVLREKQTNFNIPNAQGKTPLMLAIEMKNLELFAVMVGINVETVRDENWTLAHLVIASNHPELVKTLLEYKEDIEAKDSAGRTPLHFAAREGNLQCVRALAESKININVNDNMGRIPIFYAVENERTEMINLLAELKADLNATFAGLTPAHVATIHGYTSVIEALAKLHADLNSKNNDGMSLAHLAIDNNKLEVLKVLGKENVDFNLKNAAGDTPIFAAIANNNLAAFKILSEYKIDFTQEDAQGDLPSHAAVLKNNLDMIKILAKLNVDFNKPNQDGKSAIALAIESKNLEMLCFMLGYDLEYVQQKKLSPAHLLAEKGNLDALKILIQSTNDSSDLTYPNAAGLIPAHVAIEHGNKEMVNALLKLGSGSSEEMKYTIPQYTIIVNRPELISILRECKIDLNQKNKNGDACIHEVIDLSRAGFIQTLFEHKADLSQVNGNGMAPIHLAASRSAPIALKELLDCKIDINQQIADKNPTAAHIATANEDLRIINLLREYGADFNLRSNSGKTALNLAIERRNWPIIASMLLTFPNDKLLSHAEKTVLGEHREDLTNAFLSLSKSDELFQKKYVNALVKQENALGAILAVPDSSFTNFFTKRSRHGMTYYVHKIATELKYDPSEQKLEAKTKR